MVRVSTCELWEQLRLRVAGGHIQYMYLLNVELLYIPLPPRRPPYYGYGYGVGAYPISCGVIVLGDFFSMCTKLCGEKEEFGPEGSATTNWC